MNEILLIVPMKSWNDDVINKNCHTFQVVISASHPIIELCNELQSMTVCFKWCCFCLIHSALSFSHKGNLFRCFLTDRSEAKKQCWQWNLFLKIVAFHADGFSSLHMWLGASFLHLECASSVSSWIEAQLSCSENPRFLNFLMLESFVS